MSDFHVVPAKSVRLRALGKNEAWLEEQVRLRVDMLGPEFEGTEVVASQRPTQGGGRLDLLLQDSERDRRYVVELMLGQLDESHLIRTIEYWDIERRRYPAYEHVAVIIAEDITTRFLNVISLMAGNIPIIAMQMNLVAIENKIALQFIKVLDLRDLRRDDVSEQAPIGSDRQAWMSKSSPDVFREVDRLAATTAKYFPGAELSYLRQYLGIRVNGVADNILTFYPKKKHFDVMFWRLPDREAFLERLRTEEVNCDLYGPRAVWLRLTPQEASDVAAILDEAIRDSVQR